MFLGGGAAAALSLAAAAQKAPPVIAGVATMAEDILLKLFVMMRETLPDIRRVVAIANPTNPSHPAMLDLLSNHSAKALRSTWSASAPPPISTPPLPRCRGSPPGALFVLTDNGLLALADPIIARALSLRVSTFGSFAGPFAQAGALFAYSRDPREAFQGVARLLKKVPDGATPGERPFEQPTKFNLFVNLKTAKALGINIPPGLLATANEVIE